MTARLIDDEARGRFEMVEDGQTVFADYRVVDGRLIIDHVESPLALRGSGAAGRLMSLVQQHARKSDLMIVPLCGYAASWLRRNAD